MSYKNFEGICSNIYYIMEDLEIYKCLWSDLRRSGKNKRGNKITERDFFILRDKNNKDDCVHFSLKFIHKADEILFQNHYSDAVIEIESYEELITILNDKCNWNYTLNDTQLGQFCKFLRIKVESKIEAIDEKKCLDFKTQINSSDVLLSLK